MNQPLTTQHTGGEMCVMVDSNGDYTLWVDGTYVCKVNAWVDASSNAPNAHEIASRWNSQPDLLNYAQAEADYATMDRDTFAMKYNCSERTDRRAMLAAMRRAAITKATQPNS